MRKTQFEEGKFYHLRNHGVDKRVVFNSKEDYERFQAYLYVLNDVHNDRVSPLLRSKRTHEELYASGRIEPLVGIIAYCLLPNHFHVIATPLVEKGIEKFMHKIQTGYAMYFNNKNRRRGRLFQGPYVSEPLSTNMRLEYMYAYIHFNPVRLLTPNWHDASAEELLSYKAKILAYPYSSAGEHHLRRYVITDSRQIPKALQKGSDTMQTCLRNWLKYKESLGKEGRQHDQ